MTRKRNGMGRGEVGAKVEQRQKDIAEKSEQIDRDVSDVETERQTLDGLDLSGTSEAMESVQAAIEGAEKASQQEFAGHSQELEQVHVDAGTDQKDLQERSDSTDQDLRKMEGAAEKVHGDIAKSEIDKAKDSARRDIEFLLEHIQRLEKALEESNHRHQEHQSRVSSGRTA